MKAKAKASAREPWFGKLSTGVKTALAVFRFQTAALPQGIPDTLFLGLTSRCDLACSHCKFSSLRRGPEMSFPTACLALREAAALGIPKVIFFGGEPLLYRRLPELIKKASALGLFTELDTNGQTLTVPLARRLAGAGLCSVMVSLHAESAVGHDRLASSGSFARARQALKAALASGLVTHISCCVLPEKNISPGIERLLAFARRQGTHGVRFVPYSAPGGGLSGLPASVSAALSRAGEKDYGRTCLRPGARRCDAQDGRLLYVGPDGELRPCPYAARRRGTFPDVSLAAALRGRPSGRPPCQTQR